MPYSADVCRLLRRELDAFAREVHLFPDDAALWRVAPGITNAAGTLALHVAGNLRWFIGSVLGGDGYVRDRTAEFATRGLSRSQVAAELVKAAASVEAALARPELGVLDAPYPAAPNGMAVRTDLFLLHLVAHTAFHLGQAGYLRRIVTGDTISAGPLPLPPLVDGARA